MQHSSHQILDMWMIFYPLFVSLPVVQPCWAFSARTVLLSWSLQVWIVEICDCLCDVPSFSEPVLSYLQVWTVPSTCSAVQDICHASGIQGKIREERCWGETRWELKRSVPNSGGGDQYCWSVKSWWRILAFWHENVIIPSRFGAWIAIDLHQQNLEHFSSILI